MQQKVEVWHNFGKTNTKVPMMKFSKILLYLFIHCFALQSQAQHTPPKFELGVDAGVFVYQGDLAPSVAGSWKTIQPGLALQATRHLNSSFSLRALLVRASLSGNESLYSSPAYMQQRNFKFHTPLTELALHLLWRPSFVYRDPNFLPRWQPYAFAGLALAQLRVFRDASNINTTYFAEGSDLYTGLAQDFTHPTPPLLVTIPLGLGIRYALNDRWGLKLESNYRFTFSDYLDGFSKSANSQLKDSYHSATLGVFLQFGGPRSYTNCPKLGK
jgi:hypothetical protein